MFKRSFFSVFTDFFFYLRPPSEAKREVYRHRYPVEGNTVMVDDAAKDVLGQDIDGHRELPTDHAEQMGWSRLFSPLASRRCVLRGLS